MVKKGIITLKNFINRMRKYLLECAKKVWEKIKVAANELKVVAVKGFYAMINFPSMVMNLIDELEAQKAEEFANWVSNACIFITGIHIESSTLKPIFETVFKIAGIVGATVGALTLAMVGLRIGGAAGPVGMVAGGVAGGFVGLIGG